MRAILAMSILPSGGWWRTAIGFVLLSWTTACAGVERHESALSGEPAPAFQMGQIIETVTGRTLSLEQLGPMLREQEVIYLGEEHHNRFHIDAARMVIDSLITDGRRPVLAMEMFGWDGQGALDQYLGPENLGREEFLTAVRWKQNWGGPFEDYEPLVRLAKEQHLALIAMNPPKMVVRNVAKQGLEEVRRSAEMEQWGLQDESFVEDPAYRARILHQLKACHDGGQDVMYQAMYEASMVRDEGMAKTLAIQVRRLREGSDRAAGPVVSYTGGGHVQYNLPVPKRVARRLEWEVRQVSLYMTSFDHGRTEEIREMLSDKIADYVWLTAVSPQGPPRRCR
ncbi:MAG: ChaN family lipoprotein [Nitrospira sp.]|nr:ChaN family lipoprotein [Nitrospira sp.]